MKVLQLLAPGPLEGLEQAVRALATRLKARGHGVTVAPVVAGDEDVYRTVISNRGVMGR